MRRRDRAVGLLVLVVLGLGLASVAAMPTFAQQKAEASNMRLVGYNDLQGRGAYMPVIQKQGERWIAYVGHQAGTTLNSITGQQEHNGTSIVDVTDPRHPVYMAHIPGEPESPGEKTGPGITPSGGATIVRVCSGDDLPHADKNKFYLLRDFGQAAWEMWDVTDPAKPHRLEVIVGGLHNTHKAWWECDTGIAYLPGGLLDWPVPPKGAPDDGGDHAMIYDLSDPAKPVFIRSFGLPGQEPGSGLPQPLVGLHGLISTGPKGNRVYFSNGNSANGVVEIVDREKLLNGPREPTDENLRYPVIARIDLPPDVGVHTAFPLVQMPLPEFAKENTGSVKDFLAVIGQGHASDLECHDTRQMLHMFDITTPSKPLGVSTWTVPEASGNFCSRGGTFNMHASNENFTPIFYKRVLFISHYNAGVRALDVRDPYNPKEIAYYIPAVTAKTAKSCVGKGADQRCKIAIQTNNVEVDDRGYIYIVDRTDTGMDILELTGPARHLADFTKAESSASQR
jgi:hypothetical protein